jgi:hypothetical protein
MTNHTSSWTERERYANELWERHRRQERVRRLKVTLVAVGLGLAAVAALVAFLAQQGAGR